MWIFACVTFVISLITLFVRKHFLKKLQALSSVQESSPTQIIQMHDKISKELGAINELVCIQAQWYCENPVQTPWSKTNCLSYEAKQYKEYEQQYQERQQNGTVINRTRRDSSLVFSENRSANFELHDAQNRILVESQNANFEPMRSIHEHFVPVMNQFSNFLIAQRKEIGDRYQEQAFMPSDGQTLTVIGLFTSRNGKPVICEGGDLWLVSTKSKRQLVKESSSWAFWMGWVSLIFLIVSVVVAILAILGVEFKG
jgi:hypothetical protein